MVGYFFNKKFWSPRKVNVVRARSQIEQTQRSTAISPVMQPFPDFLQVKQSHTTHTAMYWMDSSMQPE